MYRAANTRRPLTRMDSDAAAWLDDYYRPFNAALAERLAARGYTRLPEWLAEPPVDRGIGGAKATG